MRRSIQSAALLLSLVALAAGCGTPGEDSSDTAGKADKEAAKTVSKPDVAAAGTVTLTVWDQEVRGGQEAQIKRLNQAFEQKYPNVTIKRVARSFEDLNKTLKLAVSGPKAPDVVEANQGRPIMGTLVKGGLLEPLDPYAEAFGWEDRWSPLLLDLNKFSSASPPGDPQPAPTSAASIRVAITHLLIPLPPSSIPRPASPAG